MHRKIGSTLGLGALIALMLPAAKEQDDIAAIRALRATSNAAIARNDGEGVVAVMRDDVKVIVSDNLVTSDRQAVLVRFERTFADKTFVTFLRTPARIDLSDDRTTASEAGQWTGRWRTECGERTVSGRYLARWIRGATGWQIASELFIPLRRTGDCAKR
jgi:ketosteroid isomerase-like protein